MNLHHLLRARAAEGNPIRIALIGDLRYGRTVHSLAEALTLYPGCDLSFVAPPPLRMPRHVLDRLDARGTTYREVILAPKQFSAFNAPTPRRERILRLGPESPSLSWRRALEAAYDVYRAPADERPFASTVRHFYSPVSMPGGRTPHWAESETPLASAEMGIDPHRFLFFDGIDEGGDPARATLAGTGQEVTPAPRFRPRLSIQSRVARPSRPRVERPQRGGG